MKLYFTSLLIVSTILFSCGEKTKNDCPVVDYANSFLSQKDDVIFFGNIGISEIIEKSGIYGIDDIGDVVREEMAGIKEGLALNEKIYMALAGPLDRDGTPSSTYLFMHVNDAEKLEAYLADNGFLFEEEDGLKVAEDVTSCMGMTDDLIILASAGFGEDSKSLMLEAFELANKKESNEQIREMLNLEGDINLTTNFENLYSTSNTDISKLPEDIQQRVAEMAENSFATTSLRFLPGKLEIESILDVNEKMEEFFIFNEKQTTDIVGKIGPGSAKAGMTMDVDIEKIDALLDKYAPELKEEIYTELDFGGQMLKASGIKNLSQIIDGTIGMAFIGDESGIDMVSPKVHLFAGVSESSGMIADFLTDLLGSGEIEKVGSGVYRNEEMVAKLIDDELIVKINYFDEEVSLDAEKADIPSKFENFGKQPMTLFIDVDGITQGSLGIDPMAEEVIRLVDFVSLEGGNHGAKFQIVMHDKASNILEGILMNFRDQIEGMAQGGGLPI